MSNIWYTVYRSFITKKLLNRTGSLTEKLQDGLHRKSTVVKRLKNAVKRTSFSVRTWKTNKPLYIYIYIYLYLQINLFFCLSNQFILLLCCCFSLLYSLFISKRNILFLHFSLSSIHPYKIYISKNKLLNFIIQ